MKKYLLLMFTLALVLGGGLTGCNPSADIEPEPEVVIPDEPEEPECEDVFYRCNRDGADLWPSLRTDTDIRQKIVGKWQQIGYWSLYDGKLYYEASEETREFTPAGEWIRAIPGYSWTQAYHIDSDYLYVTSTDIEPVINSNVHYYGYHFFDSGEELALKHIAGNVLMDMSPKDFLYKRLP
jgi:hypothetical protein